MQHSIRYWTLCVLLTLTVALVAPAAMAGDHVERPSLWSEVWGWVVELLDVGDEMGPLIIPGGQAATADDEAGGPYIVPNGVSAPADEAGGPYIVPNGFEGSPPGDEAGGPYIVPNG